MPDWARFVAGPPGRSHLPGGPFIWRIAAIVPWVPGAGAGSSILFPADRYLHGVGL